MRLRHYALFICLSDLLVGKILPNFKVFGYAASSHSRVPKTREVVHHFLCMQLLTYCFTIFTPATDPNLCNFFFTGRHY